MISRTRTNPETEMVAQISVFENGAGDFKNEAELS